MELISNISTYVQSTWVKSSENPTNPPGTPLFSAALGSVVVDARISLSSKLTKTLNGANPPG